MRFRRSRYGGYGGIRFEDENAAWQKAYKDATATTRPIIKYSYTDLENSVKGLVYDLKQIQEREALAADKLMDMAKDSQRPDLEKVFLKRLSELHRSLFSVAYKSQRDLESKLYGMLKSMDNIYILEKVKPNR